MDTFTIVALVLGLTFLAFWRRDMWLYIIAGLALIFFSVTNFIETSVPIGILIIVLGIYSLARAFLTWREEE